MTKTPTPDYEVVPALRDHIQRRMDELQLDPNGLAAATGLSLTVLGQVRKGYRKQYQRRLTWPLCSALRWTPDSIDRLLRGEPPVEITPAGSGAPVDTTSLALAEIRAHVERLEAEVRELQAARAKQRPRRDAGIPAR